MCRIEDVCAYANRIAEIASDISTNYRLYSKTAFIVSSWYISTSDIGVVGGSGAAATV